MTVISIIVTLLIFTVIVVVHEYGHFIVARKNDILVEEFAVGMGPIIVSKKKGDTLYSLRAFPIGGFCKMLGEEDGDDDPRSFGEKKVWQRIAVCSAGVIMNFILAVVLGSLLISLTGVRTTTVLKVIEDKPAQAAGIVPGDQILKINGKNVRVYEHIGQYINAAGSNPVEIELKRGSGKFSVVLTPYGETAGGMTNYYMGINASLKAGFFSDLKEEYPVAGIGETFNYAFRSSVYCVSSVVDTLGMMVRREVKLDDMAGPIGVGQIVDSNLQAAADSEEGGFRQSMAFVLNMAMLLSANLAVINLLPIPALDGGRIVFLLIEGIRRRPLDPEKEGWIHLVGFVLVIGLAIVVAFNDISRIFSF